MGWAGGKDLASSAAFTGLFCRALMACWLKAQADIAQNAPDEHHEDDAVTVDYGSSGSEREDLSDWIAQFHSE